MRFPADPPPGPKKKVFDPEGDCRKNGDVMFPTGTPLLVRLKMLLAFNEKFTEYGRWTGGLLLFAATRRRRGRTAGRR
jgi:hypothetical protein